MGFAYKPSNYELIQKLRKSKTAALKPNSYLKDTTKLRYYQTVGCLHFLLLNRMILGDSAGLGKTLQTIAGYVSILTKQPTMKLLVATSKSARNQWAEEFLKFTDGITVHVLKETYAVSKDGLEFGTPAELKAKKIPHDRLTGLKSRKAQYDNVKAQVFITGYYPIREDYTFLIENRLPLFMVVYDECQEFKNFKSNIHFGAIAIAKHASRVYGLSATIIKNRLDEAYSIYRVIVPGLFGSEEKFKKEFAIIKKIKMGKRFQNKVVGYKNLGEFKDRIDPYFLIRKTREVASELPHLISKKIVVDMTPSQRVLYAQALSGDLYRKIVASKYHEIKKITDGKDDLSEKEHKALKLISKRYEESLTEFGLEKNKVAALSYCQMVSNGPHWLGEDYAEGESAKEEEFKRLFDQELSLEKTIVFTRFKRGIPRLEAILDELGIEHVKVTGDVSGSDRDVARLAFQDPGKDVKVIIITQAGSAALNLQCANVLLFYDTPWSYGDLYQTIGRAQRIGSVHQNIYLLHMVSRNSIDEHVLKILKGKKELINEIMGDLAEGTLEFKKGDLLFQDDESTVGALFDSVFDK